MFGLFKGKKTEVKAPTTDNEQPVIDVSAQLQVVDGVPHFADEATRFVVESLRHEGNDAEVALALTAGARCWMRELNNQTFGGRLESGESKRFILLGDVTPAQGKAMLAFAESTLTAYERDLDGIMWFGPASKFPIIALANDDDYFRYVSSYYPDGEFALSSGMFLSRGLGHFVFPATTGWHFEPVVAHELLHAVVAHLPLPAWLNEGLASNAEFRFGARYQDPRHANDQLVHHKSYWTAERLQRYWSGDAFHDANDGQELAYDLARRMVLGLSSSQWETMREFILSADAEDAGEDAAHKHFGFSLAIAAEAVIGLANVPPDASRWDAATN